MSAKLPMKPSCPSQPNRQLWRGGESRSPHLPISVTAITNPNAMKKTWCVLLISMLFALGAVASPALNTLVTNGLSEPYGVTVDLKNNYYVSDSVNNRIAKYNPSAGALTNLAGVIGETGSNDGPGAFAHFSSPEGIVYTRGGLAVADSGNHLIRFVALDGTVTTLAGSTAGFNDGAGTAAPVQRPGRTSGR
jgi:NHL repeat